MYQTALQHFHEGRLAEAAACCSTILHQTPRDFQVLCLLGQVRSRQGAFADAAYILTAALGIGSPDTAGVITALNELATAEAAQQHYDVAIDYYRRALAIQPDDARTLYNYGNALYADGQIEPAIAVYRDGLIKQPEFAGMHNNLGNSLRSAGQLQEAADSYRSAIALSPDLVQAHNNLGQVLCLLDSADQAVESHRRALAVNPDDVDSLTGLANALHKNKRFDEACEYFQLALRRRRDDATALLGLGLALTASDRHEEAFVLLERAVTVSPTHGAARMAFGNALVGVNRHADALDHYREAGATSPVSPELKHNEAIALLAIGAWPEGWERLEARFGIPGMYPSLKLPDHLPFWRGEAGIEGKTILLQAEQGFGDTLQYRPLCAAGSRTRCEGNAAGAAGPSEVAGKYAGDRHDHRVRRRTAGFRLAVSVDEPAARVRHTGCHYSGRCSLFANATGLSAAVAGAVGHALAAAHRDCLVGSLASAVLARCHSPPSHRCCGARISSFMPCNWTFRRPIGIG